MFVGAIKAGNLINGTMTETDGDVYLGAFQDNKYWKTELIAVLLKNSYASGFTIQPEGSPTSAEIVFEADSRKAAG